MLFVACVAKILILFKKSKGEHRVLSQASGEISLCWSQPRRIHLSK